MCIFEDVNAAGRARAAEIVREAVLRSRTREAFAHVYQLLDAGRRDGVAAGLQPSARIDEERRAPRVEVFIDADALARFRKPEVFHINDRRDGETIMQFNATNIVIRDRGFGKSVFCRCLCGEEGGER